MGLIYSQYCKLKIILTTYRGRPFVVTKDCIQRFVATKECIRIQRTYIYK